MMNYLASIFRSDILFSAYQVARFYSNPKRSHEEAMKRIGWYLKRTYNEGIAHTFDSAKPIQVYVDANFARI